MSKMGLKEYIEERTSISFNGDIVECLAEDFDVSERSIWNLLDGIEKEVGERIENSIHYQQIISKWIHEEVRDILKTKIQEKKK